MKKTIAILSIIALFASTATISAQTTCNKEKAKCETKCEKKADVKKCCKTTTATTCTKEKKAETKACCTKDASKEKK